MLLRLRGLADRLRESLFFVPALYIAATIPGSLLLVSADRSIVARLGDGAPLLQATVASARATLSTIAGATITVAGIVFSVTVVSVQLASSQFSPRVLRGFMRDRFTQHIIGIVVGTFTYCLLVLTTIRGVTFGDEVAMPTAAVTFGAGLAVVAVVAIVAFIDHSARQMQVGQIIHRISEETIGLIERRIPRDDDEDEPLRAHRLPDGEDRTIPTPHRGWVQQIDHTRLLEELPAGAVLRLDVRAGDHVSPGAALGTVWPEDTELDLEGAVAIGPRQTMQQDIAFGLRQLTDIGLRALSPGVNDPTTAHEALASIGDVLALLLTRDLPSRVWRGREDQVMFQPAELDATDYVDRSFDQMRVAARTQPAVLVAILDRLAGLREQVEQAGHEQRVGPLRRQAELVLEGLELHPTTRGDAARVREAAARGFPELPGSGDAADPHAATAPPGDSAGG